jgi:hypothetical protein
LTFSNWGDNFSTCGAAGGGISELEGKSFSSGAIFAGTAAFARFGYNKFVGYDATWESGGDAREKKLTTMPYEHTNNCGTQGEAVNPGSTFGEGGYVSRVLNTIPTGNASCGLHDAMLVKLDIFIGGLSGSFMRNVLNVPLMPPAVALSSGALMANPGAMTFFSIESRKAR